MAKEVKTRVIIKKVKVRGGGHHGGAWKVAYADFVTAMMALFLVLWLVASFEPEIKSGVASYFRDPGVFDSTSGFLVEGKGKSIDPFEAASAGNNPESPSLFKGLQEWLEQELRELDEYSDIKDQIWIRVISEGLLIDLADKDNQAFFDLSSAKLTPTILQVLEKIVQMVRIVPNKVAIGGHTDSHPFSNRALKSNWELSAARALNARRAMEDLGLPSARVERVVGYADSLHLFPKEPLNSANRRVSILVLKGNQDPAELEKLIANSQVSFPD